jgi:hypothetical protein
LSGKADSPRVYRYREAANGFFEFPTENARAILPAGLQPVEPHHGQSVLAVTAFDFHESPVGSYREIVLSILVAPRILPGEPMPRAAMYPFQIATTTQASRQHGIQVWRLPHYMSDVDVDLRRSEWEVAIAVSHGGKPVLDLKVTGMPEVGWQTVDHPYQTFSVDDTGTYLSSLRMAGPFHEHEEERGSVTLHPHPFSAAVDREGVTTTPFREQWMTQGTETIFPLQPLAALAGR